MLKYLIGLGSNLGSRQQNLRNAIALLSEIMHITSVSNFYESDAMLKDNHPESWNMPYYNMCVIGSCNISPNTLLQKVKAVEHKMGRTQIDDSWAPRIIDIDILMEIGGLTMSTNTLTLPHKGLLQRDFVLMPAIEIAQDWVHPISKKALSKHLFIINTNCRKI